MAKETNKMVQLVLDKSTNLMTNLKLVEVVAQENIAVAFKQPINTRSHHFPRTWFDSSEMKTCKARTRHAKRFFAVAFRVY